MIRINNFNAVQPIVPVQKNRRYTREEPRMVSQQEQHLQGWKIKQKRGQGNIVYVTPKTETRELISIQELEWAMNCVGIFAIVLVITCIMAIVAIWYTAWIVPAVVSLAGLIWLGLKWEEWWNE